MECFHLMQENIHQAGWRPPTRVLQSLPDAPGAEERATDFGGLGDAVAESDQGVAPC